MFGRKCESSSGPVKAATKLEKISKVAATGASLTKKIAKSDVSRKNYNKKCI